MLAFRQIYCPIVFSTKYRKPGLSIEHKDELYKYIWGLATSWLHKNKRTMKWFNRNSHG